MKNVFRNKEENLWFILILSILVILNSTSYLTSGKCILLGRFSSGLNNGPCFVLLAQSFLITGAVFLIKNKAIGRFLLRLQWRSLEHKNDSFGEKIYRGIVIYAGIMLLIASYGIVFGPIYI